MKNLSASKITNMAEFTKAWDMNVEGTLVANFRDTWEFHMKVASLASILDTKTSSVMEKLAAVKVTNMAAWKNNICDTYV